MTLALLSFDNVPVLPFTELLGVVNGLSYHKGGPLWPDWDRRTLVRHRVGQRVVDTRPDDPDPAALTEVIEEPAAWCGPISRHFGHMVADFSTRIPVYARLKPLPLLLFASPPGARFSKLEDTPEFFQQILQWYGVPPERVKIVNQPTLVRKLVCTGQQERLLQVGPSPAYLQILEGHARRNGLMGVEQRGVVYCSRAGMKNKLAGEAHLERYLQSLGVEVFRPENFSLLEQLFVYATAETLIFSEGSAVHGLQLLGPSLGHVHVLRRRPRSRIAAAALRPRCRSLHYHDVGELVCGLNHLGQPATAHGVCCIRTERLMQALASAGLPQGPWDAATFETVAEADVLAWLKDEQRSTRAMHAGSMARIQAHLSHLLPSTAVAQWAQQWVPDPPMAS
jgi:hypothetical protein